MAFYIEGGGGGGTDVSNANATAENVLSGKTFYAGSDEVKTGTMTNRGAVAPTALACGGSYTVPKGFHDGTGKVTADTLANQTKVDSGKTAIDASSVLDGRQGWVNGNKVSGTMVNNNAVAPDALAPNGSYTIPKGYHNGSGKVSAKQMTGTFTLKTTGTKIDMGNTNEYRYVTTSGLYTTTEYNSKPNSNSETFTLSSNGSAVDMGSTNNYRYVDASALITKSSISGTYTPTASLNSKVDMGYANTNRYLNLENYMKISSRNVSGGASKSNFDISANTNHFQTLSGLSADKKYVVVVACTYKLDNNGYVSFYKSAGTNICYQWNPNATANTMYTWTVFLYVTGVTQISCGFNANTTGYHGGIAMSGVPMS